jgi:mRNA-degrading endonuclease RelE of RelBE toxin-antitoxin system
MSKPEMIVHPRFVEDAAALEKPQQAKLWKQLRSFLRNPNHPSLGRKLVQGASERIWEFRVDNCYRVIYQERQDQIPVLLAVGKHDEALRFAERWRPVTERRARPEIMEYMVLPPIPVPMELSALQQTVAARKYYPLGQFLFGRREVEVQLTFSQLEEIIGTPLPPSARRYRAWWGNERNSRHPQAIAWLGTGWQTRGVQMKAESVSFVRVTKSLASR